LVARVLPDRPELRDLLLDLAFPEDPFPPDPAAETVGDQTP
jgi:hypothetical protein